MFLGEYVSRLMQETITFLKLSYPLAAISRHGFQEHPSEKTKAPQTQRVTGRLADQPSPESCSLLPYRVG